MRRLALILIVAGLLCLAQAGQAADLQAGWYVKLGGVALFGIDPSLQRQVGIDWNFVGGLGTYGPFQVTQPDPLWPQRMVSIGSLATGVPSGTAVYLYGQPEVPLPGPMFDLQIPHETDYDASQMLVQLYVQHSTGSSQLLWTEPRSGHHIGTNGVLWPGQTIGPTDTLYFKVTAVPEPPACLVLLFPSIGVLWARRRAAR